MAPGFGRTVRCQNRVTALDIGKAKLCSCCVPVPAMVSAREQWVRFPSRD